MRITTLDPITLNDVTDLENAPYVLNNSPRKKCLPSKNDNVRIIAQISPVKRFIIIIYRDSKTFL